MERSRAAAKSAGQSQYNTGKSCLRGHYANRYTSNGMCEDCMFILAKEWQTKNKAKKAESLRKWRKNNRATVNAQRKRYYDRHSDACRSMKRLDHKKHRASRIAAMREQYKNNPEKYKAQVKIWRASNPDKVKALHHRRRARVMGAEGKFTHEDVLRMFFAQGGRCVGCSRKMLKDYTVDHMVPLIRGGTNWPGNLQLLCRSCNSSKREKTMEEWKIAIGDAQ